MDMSRRKFIKLASLGFAGIAVPTTAMLVKDRPVKKEIEYRNFQEVHWFDDKGKIVSVEKVLMPNARGVYQLRISKHIREKI
jgi:hypothetical protein